MSFEWHIDWKHTSWRLRFRIIPLGALQIFKVLNTLKFIKTSWDFLYSWIDHCNGLRGSRDSLREALNFQSLGPKLKDFLDVLDEIYLNV